MSFLHRIQVVDSHTQGEPTRVVIGGGPDLGSGSLLDRRGRFQKDFDRFRSAVVNEPRGSDPLVGALLCEPSDPSCAAGVIFFNNVGYLGMCGHGTIGLVATLKHLGRLREGMHRIETPVGIVSAELSEDGMVTLVNVPSYRLAKNLGVDVPGLGKVLGDVAWAGNWFFLVGDSPIPLLRANVDALTDFAWKLRKALAEQGVCGPKGEEIDHIELFGPPGSPNAHGRNFVLCPGKAYDRSPCGTGTSAKLACLFEDSKLSAGQVWRQESIVGTVFEGWVSPVDNGYVLPSIRARAYVNGEATLLIAPDDPFAWGIV